MTGGAGGIGAASCRVFAERGAKVVVSDIDVERAGALAEELNAGKAEAMAIGVDLAREERIVAMFDAVEDRCGRLDIMDNNAAILTPEFAQRDLDIGGMETEVWDICFAINTRGTMLCCREAPKIMERQRSGVIVNTASDKSTHVTGADFRVDGGATAW